MAGQDSYTKPPAQQPDLFQQLVNIEPITKGVLERRRGFTLFNTSSPLTYFTRSYGFRSDSLNLRYLVWSSASTVTVTDESGNTITPALFGANVQAPRMALSRDFGYFSGLTGPFQKWNGNNLSNWGINIASVAALTFGPGGPAAGANVTNPISIQNLPWVSPNNITALDGNYASITFSSTIGSTEFLYASNFAAFGSIGATGVVQGVQVDVYLAGNPSQTASQSFSVGLTFNGTTTSGNKSLPRGSIPTTVSKVTFGGPTDLWGNTTILGSQVNNSTFGVMMVGAGKSSGQQVDFVQITVYLLPNALTVATGSAGNITLLNGRTYFYVFQNSLTGTTSSLSAPSLSTGVVTSKQINLSGIPTCIDPQVDTVLILATADGGDQTTLYGLATIPNGTSTYTDNTPDALTASVSSGPSLLTQLVYQDTDIYGNLHGVANNNPPPIADFPIKHKGRLYMAKAHTLYFSKNLDDVTTATGTITSKFEEAWPATYSIDISEQDETIQGMLSDGETLWIGTERSIRRLVGDSPTNFVKPEIQFNEAGLLNQEVWKIVFYEGQPVGTMWMTPDLRVMSSDFNTYQDIGTPIQDVLNTINRASPFPPHACFVSGAAYDLYMLYIPVGTITVPNTVCVYDLRKQKWTIWKPTSAPSTSLFNIAADGTPQWLFSGSFGGNIFFWDPSTHVDGNGLFNSAYDSTVLTSWLDFGDPTIRKMLNQILVTTSDPGLQVTVYGATTDADLDNPLPIIVAGPKILTVGPLGDLFLPLAGATTKYRWYQFKFTSPANSVVQAVDVLDSFNVEASPIHRW